MQAAAVRRYTPPPYASSEEPPGDGRSSGGRLVSELEGALSLSFNFEGMQGAAQALARLPWPTSARGCERRKRVEHRRRVQQVWAASDAGAITAEEGDVVMFRLAKSPGERSKRVGAVVGGMCVYRFVQPLVKREAASAAVLVEDESVDQPLQVRDSYVLCLLLKDNTSVVWQRRSVCECFSTLRCS